MSEIYRHIKQKSLEGMGILNIVSYKENSTTVQVTTTESNLVTASSSSTAVNTSTDYEEIKATFKTFLNKKIQAAQSILKKPKTHTCKVNVVTTEGSLQLVVSDGTFMNEVSFLFLKMTRIRLFF